MGWFKKLKKRLKPPKKLRKMFGKGLKGLIGGIPIVGGIAKELINVDKLFAKGKKKINKALEKGINLPNVKANIGNLDVGFQNTPNLKNLSGISKSLTKALPIIGIVFVAFLFLSKKR